MRLRRFNTQGIANFRNYVERGKNDPRLTPPWNLLESAEHTRIIQPEIMLERPGFRTKRDAAEYLHDRLASIPTEHILKNSGLWTWLTLYYFDDVCPPDNGRRRFLNDYHYVYRADEALYHYRHLLAVSYQILQIAPDFNRLLLDTPLPQLGGTIEYVMRQLILTRIPCIFEVLDRLYYDEERGRAKRGFMGSSPSEGDLKHRLPARLRQLQKTYDLYVLDADQLISLLGKEFHAWLREEASARA